jgi:hypothetical protein
MRLVCWHVSLDAAATKSYLAVPYILSFMPISHLLWQDHLDKKIKCINKNLLENNDPHVVSLSHGKHLPRMLWYYAIKHSVHMMNMIPGKYHGKLALPFMLAHGVHPDQRTWVPHFLLWYLHHKKDSNASFSKTQAHTMDGIILGCSPTSASILVYNLRNKKNYKPDSDQIDPYSFSLLISPTIKYDGGLFVSLHWDNTAIISEQLP